MAAHLLLVEDEPDLLCALQVRVQAAGYTCETAANGRQALAALGRRVPDLIVTDLLMPEMDGYDLCRAVHADPRLAAVPVIVLTAVPANALGPRAAALQTAARVVHKPFESGELLSLVRELVAPAEGGTSHG